MAPRIDNKDIPDESCAGQGTLVLDLLVATTQAYPQSSASTFPNPSKASMSKENQHALGMELAAQVYQKTPVLPDNSPESIVRQLGLKLVATIPWHGHLIAGVTQSSR